MNLPFGTASGDAGTMLPLVTGDDIVRLRQALRDMTVATGLSLVDQTKVITAASELGRNTIQYGGGGEVRLERVTDGVRAGVKLTFSDEGPGIVDLDLALTDGYTTGGGLGLGLSGAKRLCDEFDIQTAVGQGTTISITKWKIR
ncbi:MAG: ATP-binding protein [Burkholderiaceae bacterium]